MGIEVSHEFWIFKKKFENKKDEQFGPFFSLEKISIIEGANGITQATLAYFFISFVIFF
jgi:hypothetical protein